MYQFHKLFFEGYLFIIEALFLSFEIVALVGFYSIFYDKKRGLRGIGGIEGIGGLMQGQL